MDIHCKTGALSVCCDKACDAARNDAYNYGCDVEHNDAYYNECDVGSDNAYDNACDVARFMHQSIPAAPRPPRADPRALAFFLPWMTNSRGWGLLSCQIPRRGDEKRGQMPRPPSTLQHFLLIAQSNSAVLSILMCNFFGLINVFLCTSARILIRTSRRDDMHQF